MAIPTVLLSMKLSYNQLTRTEKKIADYVQKNAQKVLFMSITELAEECHVADASVHRFCRTIGAKGYQEFKMWLSINMGHEKGEEESEEEDGKEPIFQQVLKSHLEAINETNQLLDKEKVDQAVRMLTEARQIMFFGVGDSKTAAIEANNKFLHVTPKVMCAGDTHLQAMAASMMTEEDLLFRIDQGYCRGGADCKRGRGQGYFHHPLPQIPSDRVLRLRLNLRLQGRASGRGIHGSQIKPAAYH